MSKITISVLCLSIFVISIPLIQSCTADQPNFEILSLNITPQKIASNEKATAEVVIRNNDARSAIVDVPLMINGVADDRTSVNLAPGATESIIFIITKNQAGIYQTSVGNKEAILIVEEPLPADFRLSGLEINPSQISPGEKIVVVAEITNVGGSQGRFTAELKIDGDINQTETIVIPAGSAYTFVFKVSTNVPGIHSIALGDLAGEFLVTEPVEPIPLIDPAICPPSNQCGPGG